MSLFDTLIMKLWSWYKKHDGVTDAHHSPYTDVQVDAIVATHTAISDAHHTKYTDAEVNAIIATHTAIAGAHHTKYTNAEAVTAVSVDDAYVKNTGDIINGDLQVNNLQVETKQNLGSVSSLHASGAKITGGLNGGLEFSIHSAYSHNAWRSIFTMIKSRGTIASPTAVINNDKLGSLAFKGYDGSNVQLAGLIEAFVDGGVSSGRVPTRISFVTGSYSGDRTERLIIKSDGKIGIATQSPTTIFDINSDIFRLRTAKTPATAGASGNRGDICTDANYIYICVATNTWKRSAISTW